MFDADQFAPLQTLRLTAVSETAFAKNGELAAQTDAQRSLKERAIQVSTDLAQTRLAPFVQAGSSMAATRQMVEGLCLGLSFGKN
jgi:hypothetical protein